MSEKHSRRNAVTLSLLLTDLDNLSKKDHFKFVAVAEECFTDIQCCVTQQTDIRRQQTIA